MSLDISELKAEYAQLRARLAKVGWISQGYVQDRGPGAGGPCYQWTRKLKAKTVSVALSKEQYQALKDGIENWRELQQFELKTRIGDGKLILFRSGMVL